MHTYVICPFSNVYNYIVYILANIVLENTTMQFLFFPVVLFFYFEAMITPGRQFKMTDKTMIMVRSAGHVVSLCASSNQRDLDHWVVLFF